MEQEAREPRWEQTNHQRSNNGERSPGGSVKRARERAAASIAPDAPPVPNTPQSPQSPSSSVDPTSPISSQRQPPQRPPRPNYVPPILSSQSQHEWEDGRDSMSGYSTSSSRASTVATGSSTASIPDFPAIPNIPPPAYQIPPRRNLGPPPSARRGASSYYSQSASFIPPIAEEASDKHSSYASSHVIPESWGEGTPDYLASPGIQEEDEETDTEQLPSPDSSGRGSKASDYSESSNLVKPARTKPLQPFMDTIESGDESASLSSRGTKGKRELDWQARQDERFRSGLVARDGIGRHNFKGAGNLHHPYSGYASDATFLDSPRSPSPSFMSKNNYGPPSSKASPARSSPIDPRIGVIMNNLERGGALGSSKTTTPGTSAAPSIHEKHGRRPPPLNLESSNTSRSHRRSSNSSLPDLIRRATRLASNLDRGKTSSRVGVLDMLARKDTEKHIDVEKSHDGSISDILAAFPSPSPTPSPGYYKPKDWGRDSPHGKSNLSRSQTVTYGSTSRQDYRPGRRCCGMPVWAFVLLCIILLLLIAAAVVIPVTLIVIPRQNKNTSPNLENCKKILPCGDRGTTVVLNNQCRCVCSQGYTGYKCETAPGNDCTTADFPPQNSSTAFPASTVGTDVSRVVQGGQSNFSIPIIGWKIAAQFSYNNLSCTDENSLITFGGQSSKLRRRFLFEIVDQDLDNGEDQHPLIPSSTIAPPDTKTLAARAEAQSSNGIVFAGGSSPGGSNAGGSSPTSTPPKPTDESDDSHHDSDSSDTTAVTPEIIDFARVAVLFSLQETGNLNIARTMMTMLNSALTDKAGFDATKPVTVGGGTGIGSLSVDLKAMTVGWGNGTLYGGKPRMAEQRRWLIDEAG